MTTSHSAFSEYRVYQYYVRPKIKNITIVSSELVTSTLDPIAYVAYHGGQDTLELAEEIFAAMQQRTNHFSSYVEPTELTFQRLILAHMRGSWTTTSDSTAVTHTVNTKRIWQLIDDMKFRNIPISIPIYRYMVRAALLDNNMTKALSIIEFLPSKEKYEYFR